MLASSTVSMFRTASGDLQHVCGLSFEVASAGDKILRITCPLLYPHMRKGENPSTDIAVRN